MTDLQQPPVPPPPPMSREDARAAAKAAKAYQKAQRPWPLRHWALASVGAVVVIVIVVVAAISFGGGGGGKAPITGQQAKTGANGSTTQKQPSNAASVGQTLTITGNDALKASVTVLSVKGFTAPSDKAIGQLPANGSYQVADISIKVDSGQYNFNPLYFKYQAANGQTFDAFDGNAFMAGFEPMLDSGTLNSGQTTRGNVVFDVPAGGKDIQIADPLGTVVGQWNLK